MITHPIIRSDLPTNFSAEDLPLELRFGGHRTCLRWLQPDDGPRLIAFFASHTPQTIYDRYGYLFTQMTPEHAARLVGVDQQRDAALGLFEAQGDAHHLIAIGRYCLTPYALAAELAFVVHEDRRCLGIAGVLLRALTIIARDRGLLQLTAQVAHDNAPMLAVFRRAGATFSTVEGTSAMGVTLTLPAAETTSRQPPPRRRAPRRQPWLRSASARAALGFEHASAWFNHLPNP